LKWSRFVWLDSFIRFSSISSGSLASTSYSYDMVDEIKLASDTLRWLNELKDEELPDSVRPRMRDLGTLFPCPTSLLSLLK
jgi:hypothetical protein